MIELDYSSPHGVITFREFWQNKDPREITLQYKHLSQNLKKLTSRYMRHEIPGNEFYKMYEKLRWAQLQLEFCLKNKGISDY